MGPNFWPNQTIFLVYLFAYGHTFPLFGYFLVAVDKPKFIDPKDTQVFESRSILRWFNWLVRAVIEEKRQKEVQNLHLSIQNSSIYTHSMKI